LTLPDFGRRIERMPTPKKKPLRIPARIPQKAGSRHGQRPHFERLLTAFTKVDHEIKRVSVREDL
jgi:hypothetical protein